MQAKKIRDTFVSAPKLLLTATPFQNSVDELYGLISLIDQQYFGSYESFQRLYSKPSKQGALDTISLRERIEPIFRRTLRKDVSHYLKYTERKSITVYHDFEKSSDEHLLNQDMMELLSADYMLLNNKVSRGFFDLIYLKLLGSSPYALNPALLKMLARFLQGLVKRDATSEETEHWIEQIKKIFSTYPNGLFHFKELASLTAKSANLTYQSISDYLSTANINSIDESENLGDEWEEIEENLELKKIRIYQH